MTLAHFYLNIYILILIFSVFNLNQSYVHTYIYTHNPSLPTWDPKMTRSSIQSRSQKGVFHMGETR